MAGPIRIEGTTDSNGNNYEGGVREMTTTELQTTTANIITTKFASEQGTASLDLRTSGSAPSGFTPITHNAGSSESFTDRKRDDSVGTHPTDGAVTVVNTYTITQGTATDNGTHERPVRVNADGDLLEMTDTEIDTEIMDVCISAMVNQNTNTCGQYFLSENAPSGGTWTSRGDITDTQVDGTTHTKKLWQKTAATTPHTLQTFESLVKKPDDQSLQAMSTAEIEALDAPFRNRIISTGVGKYAFFSSSPAIQGQSWQQMGEQLTDQVKDTATYAYAGTYTGTYSGTYDGTYTGTYAGTYTGSYAASFSGYSGTAYSGSYTGSYSGSYTGSYTGSYSGTYTGYYDGVTIISTSSTFTGSQRKLYIRLA